MDSIITGVEEVYRDNSRNGTSSVDLADGRRDNNDYRFGAPGYLVKGQPARLVRLALCSLCRSLASDHRSRIW
jgi:hypothetical protein